jgi:hypothetical protein
MAPRKPTKMWWDWSQAGRRTDAGKPVVEKELILPEGMEPDDPDAREQGRTEAVYHGLKGAFVWAMRAKPEYRWFNGKVGHIFIGDRLDDVTPGADTGSLSGRYDHVDLAQPVVKINDLQGFYGDPLSRIWPVKMHRGKQPYDVVNKTFVVPNLFPSTPQNETAYWKYFDWEKAIAAGMAYVDQPYSGQYGWIQTEMAWPLSHMVVPKEEALGCDDCHHRQGRLAGLAGFYMPGRDRVPLVDWLGLIAIIGAILGVATHAVLRIVLRRKPEEA